MVWRNHLDCFCVLEPITVFIVSVDPKWFEIITHRQCWIACHLKQRHTSERHVTFRNIDSVYTRHFICIYVHHKIKVITLHILKSTIPLLCIERTEIFYQFSKNCILSIFGDIENEATKAFKCRSRYPVLKHKHEPFWNSLDVHTVVLNTHPCAIHGAYRKPHVVEVLHLLLKNWRLPLDYQVKTSTVVS